jgi:hypothetical protein
MSALYAKFQELLQQLKGKYESDSGHVEGFIDHLREVTNSMKINGITKNVRKTSPSLIAFLLSER